MKKTVANFIITANQHLNNDYFLLEVSAKNKLLPISPGQFVEIEIPKSKAVYLRRPFSVCNVEKNKITFLIKIVGRGTRELSLLKTGENISLIYPLGQGFELLKKAQVLLVGGGCGIAPLYYLAKNLSKNNCRITLIYGGKSKKDILLLKEFKKYCEVLVTTEDGSLGLKGFVTDKLQKIELGKYQQLYTCGPEIMMKNIYKIVKNKIPLQASLEALMGCGLGVCLCCVTPTKNEGHLCVCQEGPVFKGERLAW